MRLYFLRHGEADWPGWSRPDDERPLTPEGKEKMRRASRFLTGRRILPAVILSSPLVRARETAELMADAARLSLEVEALLGPGFGHDALQQIVTRRPDGDLLLVGHEPGMSLAIWDLTGARVKMLPGSMACVELDDPNELRGRLRFLIPPDLSAG